MDSRLVGVSEDTQEYAKKMLFKVAMVLIIVGALNWGLIGIADLNVVEALLGEGSAASRIVYAAVGLAALSIMFFRDTYLPFLGPSVVPIATLPDQTPEGATRTKTIQVQPGQKVLYWASEPASEALKHIPNWRQAYAEFKNVGIATANAAGLATLKVRDPQAYTVPMKGKIEPHVHYRICYTNGMMGRVETIYIEPGTAVEGFDEGNLVAMY
jgi:uncharacterized membrane protein YuzA (DUF378 family)